MPDESCRAVAVGQLVQIDAPCGTEITLTPKAALETAKRIGDAAIDALFAEARRRADSGHAPAMIAGRDFIRSPRD